MSICMIARIRHKTEGTEHTINEELFDNDTKVITMLRRIAIRGKMMLPEADFAQYEIKSILLTLNEDD